MLDFLRDDLKLKCDTLFHHHDTMLRRNRVFLLIESGLLYFMFVYTPKGLVVSDVPEAMLTITLSVMAIAASLIWFFVAARDFAASNEYRKAIKLSQAEIIVVIPLPAPDAHVLPPDFACPTISKKMGFCDALSAISAIAKPMFGVRWMAMLLALGMCSFWIIVLGFVLARMR